MDNKSPESKSMVRVSISEAAALFGVNSQTIRRAIKSQEVTYVVVAGRYKLNFESLVKWSQKHSTVKNKMNANGIGQYVDKWKIKNPLYSPNPKSVANPASHKDKIQDTKQEEKPIEKTIPVIDENIPDDPTN